MLQSTEQLNLQRKKKKSHKGIIEKNIIPKPLVYSSRYVTAHRTDRLPEGYFS